MENCKGNCGSNCECNVNESLTEIMARIMFDSNITIEEVSKRTHIPVSHIEAILKQTTDNIDTECLFQEVMRHFKAVLAIVK